MVVPHALLLLQAPTTFGPLPDLLHSKTDSYEEASRVALFETQNCPTMKTIRLSGLTMKGSALRL